jgi:hypothetical protein
MTFRVREWVDALLEEDGRAIRELGLGVVGVDPA